jgi:hypothetical protein
MTIVSSALSPLQVIVMGVDSALTLEFSTTDEREYEETLKIYQFPGVGCVGLWGAMDGNRVGEFLRSQDVYPQIHSIVDLANLVNRYLTEDYRPGERNLGDVGYHVAGYDGDGHPHLYHIFYGFDQPRPRGQKDRHYGFYPHADPTDKYHFLFSGRTDLTSLVITSLLTEIEQHHDVRYDVRTAVGLAQLADFVLRFGAEMSPEVGPPFLTPIISPKNKIATFNNHRFSPVPAAAVTEAFAALGYSVADDG